MRTETGYDCVHFLYHCGAGRAEDGYQPVAAISLDPTSGSAIVKLLDPRDAMEVARLRAGVSVEPGCGPVTPREGRAYMEALYKLFRNSTRWRIAPGG